MLRRANESVFQPAAVMRSLAIAREKSSAQRGVRRQPSPTALPKLTDSPQPSLIRKQLALTPGRVRKLHPHSPTRTQHSPDFVSNSTTSPYAPGARLTFKGSKMCWEYSSTDESVKYLLRAKAYTHIEEGKTSRPARTPLSTKPRKYLQHLLTDRRRRYITPLKQPQSTSRSNESRLEDTLNDEDSSQGKSGRMYWDSVEAFRQHVGEKYEGMYRLLLCGQSDSITRDSLHRCCSSILSAFDPVHIDSLLVRPY